MSGIGSTADSPSRPQTIAEMDGGGVPVEDARDRLMRDHQE
jgi:hypothetical protein